MSSSTSRAAVGIHAHNDTEQAVANSLAAVRASARQIRARSMALASVAARQSLFADPDAAFEEEFSDRFEIGVTRKRWRR
jgi:2-isopropylmalate synthase